MNSCYLSNQLIRTSKDLNEKAKQYENLGRLTIETRNAADRMNQFQSLQIETTELGHNVTVEEFVPNATSKSLNFKKCMSSSFLGHDALIGRSSMSKTTFYNEQNGKIKQEGVASQQKNDAWGSHPPVITFDFLYYFYFYKPAGDLGHCDGLVIPLPFAPPLAAYFFQCGSLAL